MFTKKLEKKLNNIFYLLQLSLIHINKFAYYFIQSNFSITVFWPNLFVVDIIYLFSIKYFNSFSKVTLLSQITPNLLSLTKSFNPTLSLINTDFPKNIASRTTFAKFSDFDGNKRCEEFL